MVQASSLKTGKPEVQKMRQQPQSRLPPLKQSRELPVYLDFLSTGTSCPLGLPTDQKPHDNLLHG